MGSSIGMSQRNPLDLIKHDVPLLSEAKSNKQPRTLGPLLDAAGRDETCVWYRVSQGRHYFDIAPDHSTLCLSISFACLLAVHAAYTHVAVHRAVQQNCALANAANLCTGCRVSTWAIRQSC